MSKLVRDRIPALFENRRVRLDFHSDHGDKEKILLVKLLEEAGEWLLADDQDQALKELADLYEVLRAMAEVRGLTMPQVSSAASKKRIGRGGFDDFVIMSIKEDLVDDSEVVESVTIGEVKRLISEAVADAKPTSSTDYSRFGSSVGYSG